MPDEAKIVVVVQDGGGGPGGGRSAGPPSGTPIGPYAQPTPAGGKTKGEQEKTVFDSFLEIANHVRGLLGGIFGPLAGAALDVAQAVHQARAQKAGPFVPVEVMGPPRPAAQNPVHGPPMPRGFPIGGMGPPAPPGMGKPGLGPQMPAKPMTPVMSTPPPGYGAPPSLLPVVFATLVAIDVLGRVTQKATQAVGNFSASLVSANPSPAAFTQGLGGFIQAVGAGIPVIGGFIGAVGAAIDGVGQMMNQLDAMVDRYAGFSPALAQASAMADVAQVLGDFKRAQQVAPDLIKYLNERTAMQQQIEDQKIRFIHQIMPIQLKLMELTTKFLPYLEVILNVIVFLGKFIPPIGSDVDAIKKALDEDIGKDFDSPVATIAKNLFQMPVESR